MASEQHYRDFKPTNLAGLSTGSMVNETSRDKGLIQINLQEVDVLIDTLGGMFDTLRRKVEPVMVQRSQAVRGGGDPAPEPARSEILATVHAHQCRLRNMIDAVRELGDSIQL